jgi:prophage regulatory protein
MISKNRVALTAQQRALSAAIQRIEADAKREGRDLTEEEIAESETLTAALATLARDINRTNDLMASAASIDAHRGHALARGPPSGGESILRWRDVASRVGLSRASLWRLTRSNEFPQPVQVMGSHAVGWLSSEVEAWIASRAAQRDHQQQRRAPVSPGRPRKGIATSTSTDA